MEHEARQDDEFELLRGLGLSVAQAAVLHVVCTQADTTACAAATGLRRPQVSEALQFLEQRGLVEIFRGQRPQLVSFVGAPNAALDALLRNLSDDQAAAARRARDAADLLRRRSTALARAPRVMRPRPLGEGPVADHELLVADRTYDEVARVDSTTVRYGVPLARTRTRRRLLVLGEPRRERLRWWAAKGVEVRATDDELAVLIVVDGLRGRVEVGTTGPSRTRWTADRAQVRALQQLFTLWWEAAEPV